MSELNEIINPIIKLKENIDTLNQFKEFDENTLDSALKKLQLTEKWCIMERYQNYIYVKVAYEHNAK